MDVGDVDAKAQKLLVAVDEKLNPEDIKKHLLVHAPDIAYGISRCLLLQT